MDAEASFESWNGGFFLKRIRPKRFVFLKEQADTEAARVEELEQQLQLSKISTHIDIDDQQAELFYQMRDAFAGLSESSAIWDVKTNKQRIASMNAQPRMSASRESMSASTWVTVI